MQPSVFYSEYQPRVRFLRFLRFHRICTDETHSSAAPVQPGMDIGGIITPTVSFVLILSLSQMGIYSLAHFFILMYGQEKKSSSNS